MVRQYAQVVGVVIIVIGVVGLLLGDQLLLGLLNIDIAEDIVHLVTGGLMAYVGFARADPGLLSITAPLRTYLAAGVGGRSVPCRRRARVPLRCR